MSFNRNSTIPNKFHSFDIDTSNWPAQHRFIANLPDNPDEFTESNWLNLIIPNQESGGSQEAIDNKMDEFLEIRRKLRGYDMLADIDSTKSEREIQQIAKNLINNDTVRPNVAVLLSKTYPQMEKDLVAIQDRRNHRDEDGSRGRTNLTLGYLGDKEQLAVPLLVTTFNALLCIYAELIVKEGTSYGQQDTKNGITAIANHFFPMLTGTQEEKEFKLYMLIKTFYFDSKLYKFLNFQAKWETMDYKGTTITNVPLYESNKMNPTHLYPIMVIELLFKNKKSSFYNNLENLKPYELQRLDIRRYQGEAKQRLLNQRPIGPLAKYKLLFSYYNGILGQILVGQTAQDVFCGELGLDGSIKLLLANYLINRDPIYLYSSILSIYTHPTNGIPGFDEWVTDYTPSINGWTNDLDEPFFDGEYNPTRISTAMNSWMKYKSGTFRNTIDFNYLDKLYKFLSKKVFYKGKHIPMFIRIIERYKKKIFKPVSKLTPRQKNILSLQDRWFNDEITQRGFMIIPFKNAWSKSTPPKGGIRMGSRYDGGYLSLNKSLKKVERRTRTRGGSRLRITKRKYKISKRKTLKL